MFFFFTDQLYNVFVITHTYLLTRKKTQTLQEKKMKSASSLNIKEVKDVFRQNKDRIKSYASVHEYKQQHNITVQLSDINKQTINIYRQLLDEAVYGHGQESNHRTENPPRKDYVENNTMHHTPYYRSEYQSPRTDHSQHYITSRHRYQSPPNHYISSQDYYQQPRHESQSHTTTPSKYSPPTRQTMEFSPPSSYHYTRQDRQRR